MISPRDVAAVIADRGYQLLTQFGHLVGRDDPARLLDGEKDPVLLLPGVYETWEFLRPVGERMHELGHPVHTLGELGYNRRTIAASAAAAQAHLDARDLRRVILIGHSKGGIIGKHMMVTDDTAGRIAQLIAVCSPFAGSSLARFAPNPALRAFRPRDAVITALAADLAVNGRITSVYSRLDPLIPNGSRLEGARNVELPIVGHFRPLSSVGLLDSVENAIARQGE